MIWVGRRLDGTIYGLFRTEQPADAFHPRMEALPDDHPDVLAFRNRTRPVVVDPRDIKLAELEARIVTIEGITR